jgi:hypothetical protein
MVKRILPVFITPKEQWRGARPSAKLFFNELLTGEYTSENGGDCTASLHDNYAYLRLRSSRVRSLPCSEVEWVWFLRTKNLNARPPVPGPI